MLKKIGVLFATAIIASLSWVTLARAETKPNIVLIQTDDQALSFLNANYLTRNGEIRPVMPTVRKLFVEGGMTFNNFYSSTPICGPSRAALLSGQYAHNNKVITNNGQFGGWPGWKNSPAYERNLPLSLQEKGYHTAHLGKFTNHYGPNDPVPPGWDTWITDNTDDSTRDFYGYFQYEKIPWLGIDRKVGPIGKYGYRDNRGIDPPSCRLENPACNYHTDRMSRMAALAIENVDDPLYLQLDYHAPHVHTTTPAGAQPATRHLGSADRTPLPGTSILFPDNNYNEKNLSDKPYVIRRGAGLIRGQYLARTRNLYRRALESLRAVDEGVAHLYQTLQAEDKLENTYIFFVSDNGYFHGDHRFIQGKQLAYEESAKVPFAVYGPKVLPATSNSWPASTVDIAPTFMDIAGGSAPYSDGLSLFPVMKNVMAPAPQRSQLIEFLSEANLLGKPLASPFIERPIMPNIPAASAPSLRWTAVKSGRWKYISYERGGEELYNLGLDPSENYNLARDSRYRDTLSYMREELFRMRYCEKAECVARPSANIPQ